MEYDENRRLGWFDRASDRAAGYINKKGYFSDFPSVLEHTVRTEREDRFGVLTAINVNSHKYAYEKDGDCNRYVYFYPAED